MWDEAIRLKMITMWWFKVGFWWFTRLENIKNKELIYDPKFVYSHKPMSHHKIRFHLILLPKFLKFFFRTNWFRFNRNYRAFHSAVTFSWTFWGECAPTDPYRILPNYWKDPSKEKKGSFQISTRAPSNNKQGGFVFVLLHGAKMTTIIVSFVDICRLLNWT